MLNYDQPSHIFPCILLTSNHLIFLVQFGINKHLCLFIPNCTWNHVITYTKQMILAKIALVSAQLPSYNYIDKFLLLTGRQCWTIPIMSSRNESVIHSLAYTGCFKMFSTTSCVRYWSWIILNSMYIFTLKCGDLKLTHLLISYF